MVQSTPDKHLQRSNGRSDEELFFDMDGMDETELRISSHEMTNSDDEDDVDNDDSHCGKIKFIVIISIIQFVSK